ncbi:MAG: sigma-54 dependent transcriptional regulator [Saprospiraceae bacterium]|nr:sigma-54 dependent transcriptional regulator [Saprospiraceae bacterium]
MKRYVRDTNQVSKIFVVEDDPTYQRMIRYTIELNPDHEVYAFSNAKDCLDNMYLKPTIVSLDYSLPDMNGEEVLKQIKKINPRTHVIILSGQKDVSTAINLLKKGASDYITKGDETQEHLLNSVNLLKENNSLLEEVVSLRNELTERYQFGKTLIGTSDSMKQVFNLLEKAIENEITISITGETGTGKEVVAKTIHYNSIRKKGSFIAVNMSAIPKDLLESELFGYEKGAFTGASSRKKGKFELANKGTLFLDEIGEMDLQLQAKLLRALQEREVVRIGGNQAIKFDARVIVATHKDLADEVRKGNFREDLYYRLLGLPVELPPLRDREGDILILAQHFLELFMENNPKRKSMSFSIEAKQKLLKYAYPGNVRELKAIVDLAAVLSSSQRIKADSIQFRSPQKTMELLDGEMTMKEYMKKIVYHYLKKYKNVMKVAKKLEIGKSTIYNMIKEDRVLNELMQKY